MTGNESLECSACGRERKPWVLVRFNGKVYCQGACLDLALETESAPLEVEKIVRGDIRDEIRAWAAATLAANPEMKTPELIRRGIEHFRRADFEEALYHAVMPRLLQIELEQALRPTREQALRGELPAALEARAQAFAERFNIARWAEKLGERRVLVLDMTRDQLRQVARLREQEGREHLRLAALCLRLAERLRDGERVRDRFSVEEIERLRAQIDDTAQVA